MLISIKITKIYSLKQNKNHIYD